MSELFVSWADYHRSIENLIAQVHRSGWPFDHVVCIARGGARVGDVVARAFRKPLHIVLAQHDASRAGSPLVSDQIASLGDAPHGAVLLVDDVAASGATLATVKEMLVGRYPAISEVRTAVVWQQG
ncbi:MAG TPA: phosphoribosyltransferase family protein, partial [Casimicrobiaceae bacterium]|nr:phosphoribosyltransferase family protein [Casimicrobiaceae bacterium]